jgi:hypothetical protein
MVKRYFVLEEFLESIDTVQHLLPSRGQCQRLKQLLPHMEAFESITKKLQSDNIDLYDARALFDGLFERYPEMKHLSPDNRLIRNPTFETAIIKILNHREDDLNNLEAESVECFKKSADMSVECEVNNTELNLADTILAKRRKVCITSKYVPLAFVLPTSNIVERLFSTSKYVLNACRKHMHPVNFEMIVFFAQ